MGKDFAFGQQEIHHAEMDFFISPAYFVPPIRMICG